MHDALDLRDLLPDELCARKQSGYDVSGLEAEIHSATAVASGPADGNLDRLYTLLEQAPRLPGWGDVEPEDEAASIESLAAGGNPRTIPSGDVLADRILGAWLGRCAGCILGKPVEGWTHEQVRSYLTAADAHPLDDYLPPPNAALSAGRPPMKPSWVACTRGRIDGVARDDDLDYTVLALHIVESHGDQFTVDDVAAELLDHMPFTQVYTAERVAYRNLIRGVRPSSAATVRNPYREWIGGLIRADLYGYVSPGDARRAATLAARDAALSHRGTGLHAAMWAAALIAECLTRTSAADAVRASLHHVPPGGRLAHGLGAVVLARNSGLEWAEARRQIADRYDGYSWVHSLNNASVIAAALLWGDDDFGRSIGLAVEAGWDTDSNGATVGSAMGALLGAGLLPARLVEPLDDRISTAISGFDAVRVSELAARTVRLVGPHAPRVA